MIKLLRPERWHIEHNFEKIVSTLVGPDEVRQSSQHEDCFIAYKKFDTYCVLPGVNVTYTADINYLAVVCDGKRKIIKTFYPTQRIKSGKLIWKKSATTK